MTVNKKKAAFRLAVKSTSYKFGMLSNFLKQAEALTGHIEMLDSLFRHATEGIVVVNAAGEIAMVNPRALNLFGYEMVEELIGKSIDILIHRRYVYQLQDHRNSFMIPHSVRKMEVGMDLLVVKKDGTELPVDVSLSPFSTSEYQFVVSFITDISERK